MVRLLTLVIIVGLGVAGTAASLHMFLGTAGDRAEWTTLELTEAGYLTFKATSKADLVFGRVANVSLLDGAKETVAVVVPGDDSTAIELRGVLGAEAFRYEEDARTLTVSVRLPLEVRAVDRLQVCLWRGGRQDSWPLSCREVKHNWLIRSLEWMGLR